MWILRDKILKEEYLSWVESWVFENSSGGHPLSVGRIRSLNFANEIVYDFSYSTILWNRNSSSNCKKWVYTRDTKDILDDNLFFPRVVKLTNLNVSRWWQDKHPDKSTVCIWTIQNAFNNRKAWFIIIPFLNTTRITHLHLGGRHHAHTARLKFNTKNMKIQHIKLQSQYFRWKEKAVTWLLYIVTVCTWCAWPLQRVNVSAFPFECDLTQIRVLLFNVCTETPSFLWKITSWAALKVVTLTTSSAASN